MAIPVTIKFTEPHTHVKYSMKRLTDSNYTNKPILSKEIR